MAIFPVSRGKNRISQGVEDWGSLISVPQAHRVPMRLPNLSLILDEMFALIGPGLLSGTGAGVWRKAPGAFLDSSSVLDRSVCEHELL